MIHLMLFVHTVCGVILYALWSEMFLIFKLWKIELSHKASVKMGDFLARLSRWCEAALCERWLWA